MQISDNILREQLKNVYFLGGGGYGGKTTMSQLIAKKYGLTGSIIKTIATTRTPRLPPLSFSRPCVWTEQGLAWLFCPASGPICPMALGYHHGG